MTNSALRFRMLAGAAVFAVGLTGISTAIISVPANAAPVAQAALADTDGDGLPDVWETNGYDADGDGQIDVDLPAMGANPNKKDLFVEMDYMQGRLPGTAAMDRIKAVFAAAPVSNPDNTTGINIHLDAGAAGGSNHNLGGGNQVPYDSDLKPYESQINAIKDANFDSNRDKVFRYMIWADDYDSSCSSGVALGIPSDTFVVTMGPRCDWNTTENMQVGTFIHELGHTLGLKHGGADHSNYKPNYLSVMNYSFQFTGVPKTDGSFNFGYSSINPASLKEGSLNESAGLGAGASAWKTTWFCPDKSKRTTSGGADQPIDWNCNGTASGTVSADINKDGSKGTLTGQNNWASISFRGGNIGSGQALKTRSATFEKVEAELSKADWDLLQQGIQP